MANEDINVGAISEALNNKVDLNQLNTNTQGLSYGSGWGMPSGRYIDLQLGASGTSYTAPANGWFCISKIANANNQYLTIALYNLDNSTLRQEQRLTVQTGRLTHTFPVLKDDKVKITYNATGET